MPEIAGPESNQWSTLTWRKSRHSNPSGECVEVAELTDGQVAMRNSRDPNGARLVYTRAEVAAFIDRAKNGQFDHLLG